MVRQFISSGCSVLSFRQTEGSRAYMETGLRIDELYFEHLNVSEEG